MWKRLAVAAMAGAATACSSSAEHRDAAEAEVGSFHRVYDQREPQRLYDAASDDLKRLTGRDDFIQLMTQLHDDYGPVREANRTSWSASEDDGRTTIRLGYDTYFQRGRAAEQFTYRVEGGRPILVTYRIRSDGTDGPQQPPDTPSPAPPKPD